MCDSPLMQGSVRSTNHALLAAQLVRALRGKRSQMGFSRRLGYSTNILYIWEAQKGAPTGSGFFEMARKAGVNVEEALLSFYRDPPPWMSTHDPASVHGVAAFLGDLRGNAKLVDIERSLRCSRYALSRWLKGSAEPRLPDLLQAIDVMSLRLLDFVACFTDPAGLSSVTDQWEQLQDTRRVAYERPWSHAVLRALELVDYRRLTKHEHGWLAARLGLSLEEEANCIEALSSTGQIKWHREKWMVQQVQTIDTRRNPQAARELKAWWFGVGIDHFQRGTPGVFSYNLFAVSRADLKRIESLQRAYFRELRSIVAQSEPAETVALVSLQLMSLLQEDRGQ